MNDQLTEKQSLVIIQEMMHKGKRNLKEGSIFYLIWGWAVLLAASVEYVLLTVVETQWHWIVWPIAMFSAAIVSVLAGRRQQKQKRYVTFTDTAMKYTWIGFTLYLFIVLFMSQQIGWTAAYALVIGLYGLGTFISGGVLQFKPLIIGGLLSLGLSVLALVANSVFSQFPNILLLLCASILVSYLIPGYMLRAKKEEYAA